MKHHYVPQFLLRPWAEGNRDGKLQVFRLDLPEIKLSRLTPKNTGYEDDLYALSKPVIAGMEKQAVEIHLLRHVDNLAARVRQKFIANGLKGLSNAERSDWVRFLLSMRIRQPNSIQELIHRSSSHLRQSLASSPEQYEVLREHENAPTLEEWAEARFPGLIDNFGLSFLHTLIDNKKVGTEILRMMWWLWDFSDEKYNLFLSDNPCVFTKGLDAPDVIIALPISPTKAFLATKNNKTMSQIMKNMDSSKLIVGMNESSFNQARARIYAKNSSPKRFISNRWKLSRA